MQKSTLLLMFVIFLPFNDLTAHGLYHQAGMRAGYTGGIFC